MKKFSFVIKSCPFCGLVPKVESRAPEYFHIGCKNKSCKAIIGVNERSLDFAILIWNTRKGEKK